MGDFEKLNPILKCDYPDPDVIRVDNTYYMVSTTMYFMPGGVILKSYNLVDWEIEGYIFEKIEDNEEERLEGGKSCYGRGMWAASLRYHEGKFYSVFVSQGREDTHLYVAEKPQGPWEHSLIKGYYHDCSLLWDEDQPFIVYGNTEIHLTELTPDLSGPKPDGIDKVIIRDDSENVILGYEGSHFYKINGKYYVTLIHWPKSTKLRTEAVFMSDSIDGEYKGRDVLSQEFELKGQGIAQGGLIQEPGGNWFSIMFRDSGAVGRIPILVPVTWQGEFPVWGDNGKLPNTIITQDLQPDYKYEPLYTSDSWARPITQLKKQWQWNHIPNLNFAETLSSCDSNQILGGLQITTDCVVTNLLYAHNTLTQRMMYPACQAEVTLDAGGLQDGDTAGFAALQHMYGFIGIRRENQNYKLIQVRNQSKEGAHRIGDVNEVDEVITDEILLESPIVRLRIEADFTEMRDTFTYCYESDSGWLKLGESHRGFFSLSHFTGARFALFIYSTKRPGGKAIYRDFKYIYENN